MQTTTHILNFSSMQNVKPHDEREESDDDSEFDAFAEELDRDWYDLIELD